VHCQGSERRGWDVGEQAFINDYIARFTIAQVNIGDQKDAESLHIPWMPSVQDGCTRRVHYT